MSRARRTAERADCHAVQWAWVAGGMTALTIIGIATFTAGLGFAIKAWIALTLGQPQPRGVKAEAGLGRLTAEGGGD